MNVFRAEVQTHSRLLTQTLNSLKEKFSEVTIYTKRQKRGLIDGVGSIIEAITGNLSDWGFFSNSINQLNQGQLQVETLCKNQINATKSVVKICKETTQKLQINEKILNEDIKKISKHN